MSTYKDKYIKYKKKYIDLKNKFSGGSDAKILTEEYEDKRARGFGKEDAVRIIKNIYNWFFEKAAMEVEEKEVTFNKFKEAVMKLSDLYKMNESKKKKLMDLFSGILDLPETLQDSAARRIVGDIVKLFVDWGYLSEDKLKMLAEYIDGYEYLVFL